MEEIYKVIQEFDKYEVSNTGNIRNVASHKILIPWTNNKGYLVVGLRKNGKTYRVTVHRLVAQAFIPNPNNYPQVNHIDENKSNNNVINLEWCTNLENRRHGTVRRRIGEHFRKPVEQLNFDNNVIRRFSSITEASSALHLDASTIGDCCRGIYSQSGGFKWRFC